MDLYSVHHTHANVCFICPPEHTYHANVHMKQLWPNTWQSSNVLYHHFLEEANR